MNNIKKEAAIYVAKLTGMAIGTGIVTSLSIFYIGLVETCLILLFMVLVNIAFEAFDSKVKELEHLERLKKLQDDRAQRLAELNLNTNESK